MTRFLGIVMRILFQRTWTHLRQSSSLSCGTFGVRKPLIINSLDPHKVTLHSPFDDTNENSKSSSTCSKKFHTPSPQNDILRQQILFSTQCEPNQPPRHLSHRTFPVHGLKNPEKSGEIRRQRVWGLEL